MEFYPRNEAHARRELQAQLSLFDPQPMQEGNREHWDLNLASVMDAEDEAEDDATT